MRFAAAFLLLASCGGPPAANEVAAPDAGIACRPACTVERAGDLITVRKADGGFRRLLVTRDGGIAAADGAERAESVRLEGGMVRVSIGGDRFQLGPL